VAPAPSAPPQLVRWTVDDGVALLTLDHPPLNLVTLELTDQLGAGGEHPTAHPTVRVLVVTGAGRRAFCAGSDVSEFAAVRDDVVPRKLARENDVYRQLDRFPRPTIAALNGLAYGGGLELAACCDLVVAGADVRLALPEIKLGVFPGSGGTFRIARRLGEGRAKELIFLGDPIDAETAFAWGLVNRIVPAGEAVAAALDLARTLATRPARALELAKAAIDLGLELPADEALRRTLALSEAVFLTDDCREGVRAFLAKEPPRFGRS
jgi:enoyl-CoA hydratase